MNRLFGKLKNSIPYFEKTNPIVSNSSVGWHIEHSLLTICKIIDALENSNPNNYIWKFNPKRLLIKTLNFIPRGKAKAPKVVIPSQNSSPQALQINLEETLKKLSNFEKLHKHNYFEHPVFGKLNKKDAQWFLKLHTKHHLKIINDIIK